MGMHVFLSNLGASGAMRSGALIACSVIAHHNTLIPRKGGLTLRPGVDGFLGVPGKALGLLSGPLGSLGTTLGPTLALKVGIKEGKRASLMHVAFPSRI